MAYIITPDLGLALADPNTIQAFETTNVNSNFLLLEAGIKADRVRLTAGESRLSTLELYGRIFKPNTPADLQALNSPPVFVGDLAEVLTPGTGITRHLWEAVTGTPSWMNMGIIQASSKANMDAFIAVVAALSRLSFKIGTTWVNTTNGLIYQFTSAAGAYVTIVGARSTVIRGAAAFATGASLAALPVTAVVIDSATFTNASGVYTCVVAGTYEISYSVSFAASGTGARAAALAHSDGSTRSHQDPTVPAGIDHTIVVHWVKAFTAGQTFTVQAQQNSGGNLNVTAEVSYERIA